MPAWKRFVAGSLSGALGAGSSNPFDLVKTRMQVPADMCEYTGLTNAFSTIMKGEGWKAFYKGVGASVCRDMLGSSVNLTVQSVASEWMAGPKTGPGPGCARHRAIITTAASSLWLSATNVRYRDIENALPFFTQLLLFLSPIAYPATMIPDSWRWLYAVNPMSTVISAFRFSLLGDDAALHPAWLVSVAVALLGCWTGILYFRHQEERFADAV